MCKKLNQRLDCLEKCVKERNTTVCPPAECVPVCPPQPLFPLFVDFHQEGSQFFRLNAPASRLHCGAGGERWRQRMQPAVSPRGDTACYKGDGGIEAVV